MFRDRTNLYISYRRTYPHRTPPSRFDLADDEERGLIGGNEYRDEVDELDELNGGIEMRQLPPSLTEVSMEVEAILSGIEARVSELGYLYKKNILPGFNDTSAEDQKIDDLTFGITRDFQRAYSAIKNFEMIKIQFGSQLKNDELMMCDNMKRNLALKTQTLSKNFRRLQNNYIKFLKEDDYENFGSLPTTQASGLEETDSSAQIESYSREAMKQSQQQLQQQQQEGSQNTITDEFIEQREREIFRIAQGVIEVSTIFKELENMVIDQGTILDRIDYNLANTVVHMKEADKQLQKGEKYQKNTAKCKIIMLLCLLVFLLLMVVVSRPSRTDHYVHDGNSGTSSGSNSPDTDVADGDATDGDATVVSGNPEDLPEDITKSPNADTVEGTDTSMGLL
ncbi:unnamed protein product [Kuraishia capsulata CBS 1993]|uniref:t-SNARE coiled-coil homology domain-containing protein n=1 Tax=Kuraishia capsulata CBS 1993 TaxID=1382522 RepID=W6MKG2_9ASCO|nr:uncharacterized protein KUCA_T00001144001 [Kuraishia capsulata CBS 1993]CDK25177.1 unnamed protein product [Kuraishia capsulata CBS 1993]